MIDSLKAFAAQHVFKAPEPVVGTTVMNTSPSQMPSTQNVPPVQDNEFIQVLRDVLNSRRTAFTDLVAASDKLSNVVKDPTERLKAAFAFIAGDGRGLPQIVEAITIHLQDLEGQRMTFEQSMKAAEAKSIGALQEEQVQCTNKSAATAAEIQNLKARIQELEQSAQAIQARMVAIEGETTAERARLETAKQKFFAAMQVVKAELETKKATVQSTLAL